ncbi:MAG: GYF domain-containing protein, partial [Leptonema sp. (in: bacteria)]
MNERYYIVVNGQQAGPFTIEELKSKGIQPDTLVWTEGLENWTKAKYIPFLKDVLRATPPPIPNTEADTTSAKVPPTTPPPVSNDKYFGYELALRRERLLATIIENIVVWVPITMLLGDSINDIDSYSADYIVIDVILSLILGAFFYKIWGGNLGHKIMGLVVISAKDGQIQNNAKIGAIREVLKSVFSLFFIPVVWLLWDDDRQNLYDKVVRTYVVRKNRQEKERQIKNFLRGCLIFFLTFFFLTFLLIWGSIYFYINGISVVANYVVEQIPISVDKEVGREARREILDSLPIDEEKTKILTEFYSALGYDNKTKVYVVKGREFNAFALPDNSIFVFDQVLREVKSYPELAALLGHEYAHIKNRHGMKNLAHAVSRELLTAILAGSDRSNTL